MPTPGSGAISMNDMRTEITRATSSSLSMSEIRTRYGGSGSISFSDLYKCEGFTVTCGTQSSKYISFDGWNTPFGVGSVSPNEASGYLQFAANSYLGIMEAGTGTNTGASMTFYANTGLGVSGITAGFRGDSVTRIVTANTSRSITASAESSTSFTYDMPSSGTIHCLIKF